MGLFDIFKKNPNIVAREEAERLLKEQEAAAAKPDEKPDAAVQTPEEKDYAFFETVMNDSDPQKRSEAIQSIKEQYWLYRIAKEGTFENDRIAALRQMTDQEFIFRIVKEEGNIPRVYSLAQDKLDDAHRLQMMSVYADHVTEIDKKKAVAKVSDTEILKEIINHAGWGRAINLEAAGRLERIAPDDIGDTLADYIKFMRENGKR